MPADHRDRAERSLLALKRAGFKLVLFAAAAALQASAGHGFLRTFATLAFLSSVLLSVLALVKQERATAPYYTSLDEAAWFFILGYVLRHWQ